MPAPFLWLGAGALALLASAKYSNDKTLSDCVNIMPGHGDDKVSPVNGAIVCCGVYGWFIHTGIWVDGNIIELKGNGLIRGVSPARFLHERSGDDIFMACNEHNQPLTQQDIETRAISKLFSYSQYDLVDNNCYKFVWHCLTAEDDKVTRFSDLNQKMAKHFATSIHWQPILY